MRTENDLRTALTRLAEDTPHPDDVLGAVRTAGRRRGSGRPRLMIGVAVATALAAAAVPLTSQLLDRGSTSEVTPATAPSRPANPLWQHRYDLTAPTGFGTHTDVISRTGEKTTLSGPPTAMCDVAVYERGRFDPRLIPAAREPVTVQGRPGWYARFADPASSSPESVPRIAWEHAAKSWAVVVCNDPAHEIDVKALELRFANGLAIRPRRLPTPFAIAYLPAGLVVHDVTPMTDADPGMGGTTFGIRALRGTGGAAKVEPTLYVSYRRGTPSRSRLPISRPSMDQKTLTIDGRPATLTSSAKSVNLTITGEGFQLRLEADSSLLGDAERELVRIAEDLELASDPNDESTWFDATTALP